MSFLISDFYTNRGDIMAILNPIESNWSYKEREKLNNNWTIIESYLSNLQGQINLLTGDVDVQKLVDQINDILNQGTVVIGDLEAALQDAITVITNVENATTDANNAAQDALNTINDMQAFINQFGNAESYDNEKLYKVNNIVEDKGSGFICIKDTQGNPPPTLPAKRNEWWQLLAQKGVDGTGAVSKVAGKSPDDDGNVLLSPIDIGSTDIEDILQRAINVKFPPPPLVAAVGNGIVDDQPAIQAVIDYAHINKYNVYIPNSVYRLNNTLKRKGYVSIYGQSFMLTELKFYKANGGAVIDMVNEPLHGVTIQGFKITKDQSVTGNTIGILGGSTLQLYNSAIGTFRDIRISGLTYGICGNGEPTGVGIFDCMFENIFISDCFIGIRFDGSGNILKHPRIVRCDIGISFEYLNAESYAGINVIGGVFIQNGYDVGIPNIEGIRPCSFNGTWFEQASSGLINIPNVDTKLMSLSFRDCMLSISGQLPMLNAQNAVGPITIDTCTVAQVGTSSTEIIAPTSTEGVLKVSNTLKILNDDTRSILNFSKNNAWSKVLLLNGWVDVNESTYTKYFKTDDNIVHLQIGMKDGVVTNATIVGNLPAGYRPVASVRFFIRDATNSKTANMYIDPSGNIVISGNDYLTGIWAGYISYRADA